MSSPAAYSRASRQPAPSQQYGPAPAFANRLKRASSHGGRCFRYVRWLACSTHSLLALSHTVSCWPAFSGSSIAESVKPWQSASESHTRFAIAMDIVPFSRSAPSGR